MNFAENYEKNRIALNVYRWWRHEPLPEYEALAVKAINADNNEYVGYLNGEITAGPIKIERTVINTKPFFRNLDKPLLVKNEFNSYNIEYVVDSVRKSEDYGGDNHIYMYYENIRDFVLFLQVVDITPYLKGDKLVFIFGEEELKKDYPLDFRGIYGIYYDAMPSQPIRADEINRIFFNWQVRSASGARCFFDSLWDGHPNIVKITTHFPFEEFVSIYKFFLRGKTVLEFYEMFFTEFNGTPGWGGVWKEKIGFFWSKNIEEISFSGDEFNRFWQTLVNTFPQYYVPKIDEWLKAFAAARIAAFNTYPNARVAPAVMMYFIFNPAWQYVLYNLYPVLKQFKHMRAVTMVRRLTMNVGAYTDDHNLERDCLLNNIEYFIRPVNVDKSSQGHPLYLSHVDEWLPYRRAVRFEDVKLETVASMESLCDFFDIPMDDALFDTTLNGKSIVHMETNYGEGETGMTTKSVFNRHETRFSPEDYYRMEVVMGKEYEYYGYKPMYYTDGKQYSNDEIMEMFKKSFKVEEFDLTERQKAEEPAARERLYASLKKKLAHPYDEGENGEKLVPIPWLKPKAEFMKGKLYE